ncbi:MAG: NTP transferase domain-containing protein [Anaplasmataceae bacterium]|nr:NTP transferase domain-containing protein [Anaplasmataceae bacterium]
MKELETLVIPVAGRGKRLLPLTLTKPKALVKVAGKTLLDYVIEEGVQAGFKRVVVVADSTQLLVFNEVTGAYKEKFPQVEFFVVEQEKPLGTGDALWRARDLVQGGAVAMRYPDDLLLGEPGALTFLTDTYGRLKKSLLLAQEVTWERARMCGVLESAKEVSPGVYSFSGIQEQIKNKSENGMIARDPSSNLAIIGGYVFSNDVFYMLEEYRSSINEEDDSLPINVVFSDFLKVEEILAIKFAGKRFDCGNLEGLSEANDFLSNTR